MSNVPPDLFRRKKTFQLLRQVEERAQELRAAGVRDNSNAVLAGYNDLAAHFASLAGRVDIARSFEIKRDELIVEAQTAPPLRSDDGVRKKR